jgi:NAD(P)-dependent dehydrogenase (short-subunit alcohol dehydrogenase family)
MRGRPLRAAPAVEAGYWRQSFATFSAGHRIEGISGVQIGPGATALTRMPHGVSIECIDGGRSAPTPGRAPVLKPWCSTIATVNLSKSQTGPAIMDPRLVNRREAAGMLSVGLATVAASDAMGRGTEAQNRGVEKDSPLTKYPKPPFAEQTQAWPGLAGKMTPKPDHGETSYRGSGRLTGPKALITGGDSGMGRAAAIAYAREGADVAINYLPAEEDDAREVIRHIKEAGRVGIAIPGDLRDRAFCQRLVNEAAQKLGGLDVVVCNAGRQQARVSILDISDDDFDATMKTNIYAPFYIIKAALHHLSEGSCIIGTTSEQAYDPSPELYDYAQTKAATMNYVKSLAKQLGPRGIRVNGVAPGPIWTPLQISGGASVQKYTHFGSDYPLARPGQPAELASIYVQLAASDASFTTGNIYGAGGGKGQP